MSSRQATSLLQAAALPFRIRNGRLECCLITSINKGRWGIPKGIIDPGETPKQTALKEALEEAGLEGRILKKPLGQFEYRKWGTTLSVTVFLMRVTACSDDWEEAHLRKRRWFPLDEAADRVFRDDLRRLFEDAKERIPKH